jgi:hypothetical protein
MRSFSSLAGRPVERWWTDNPSMPVMKSYSVGNGDMYYIVWRAVLPLLLCAGCMFMSPQFTHVIPAKHGMCVLYIYWPDQGPLHAAKLSFDGEDDVGFRRGTYVRRELSCGRRFVQTYRIVVNWFQRQTLASELAILQAGEPYFIRYRIVERPGNPRGFYDQHVMETVDPKIALEEMRQTRAREGEPAKLND